MKYFKNKELVALYNVSDKTVRNWIAASQDGKLDLKLSEEKGKIYIADSLANDQLLSQIVSKGKKYRNNRNHKNIKPTPEFYKQFNPSQIVDIVGGLDNYHELFWHYMYFGKASEYWNEYLHELLNSGRPNLLTNTIETLDLSATYVDALTAPYKHVNIINICVGNSLGVIKTLKRLESQKKLRRFITIDISEGALAVSERNVKAHFSNSFVVEKHVLDVRGQNFKDILARDTFGDDASKTINLIYFISGPIVNFKFPQQVLQTINSSMNKNDYLFTSLKRNTSKTRQFFDFNIKSDSSLLGQHHKVLLDQIGIDETLYELEQEINIESKHRYIGIRLKTSLSIFFETGKFQKTVHFERGETILIWRARQYNDQDIIDELKNANFTPIYNSQSLDHQLTLLISKINTGEHEI